jgi:hypothetical protein
MASSGNRNLISIQAAWHQWPTWYSMQILRAVFSAKVALLSVFSPNTRFARWGVVQPVGHLTVNAHEGVAHETAGFGKDTQTPMFMRFSIASLFALAGT